MSFRGISLVIAQVVSGISICWMKDEDGNVSVMAKVPESCSSNSSSIAEKAEKIAIQEAGRIGFVSSSSVYMGGDGKGKVSATGIAVLPWTPDVEKKLSMSGLQQVV